MRKAISKKSASKKTSIIDLKIEVWSIDKPIPYARNPRQNEMTIDKVAASLKEFGWQQPIVVDQEGVVVVGHTRLAAAKKLEMTEVPIIVAKDLTKAQAKAYRIMDNRSHDDSKWDFEMLPLELVELRDMNFNLDLTGFDPDQYTNLIDTLDGSPTSGKPEDEWTDMPDFNQPAKDAFRSLVVHFVDAQAVIDFMKKLNKPFTDKTKYIWYPETTAVPISDKRYVAEEPEEIDEPVVPAKKTRKKK
jgi:hypothetical protein